jgi:hypothetical protein
MPLIDGVWAHGYALALMAGTTEELIYNEAVRAIEHQERALDELRSRAGTVLAAVSLVTSFLGARVLAGRGEIHFWGWVGIALAALCAILTLLVIWPWDDWAFSNDPAIMMNAHRDNPQWPDSVYVYLVDTMGADRAKNGEKLTRLYGYFRWSIVLLIGSVGAWLIQLWRG